MLSHTLLAPALLLAVAAVSLPAMAQTTQPVGPQVATAPTDLPVTHVSLFSSGVGFFEHAGSVLGDGTSALRFKTEQVNDVLKSLVLQDYDGGQISTVSYQSQDPLEKTLGGFQVDLSGEPAIWQLLGQLRGAEVLVAQTAGKPQIVGKILGVETRKKPAGDSGTIDYATLNLVTPVGIQSIAIDEAQSIQLTDTRLQDELNKALLAVAGARDNDKKSVTIHFKGSGERRVRMGYVVETPIWKASYRLMIGDDKSNLQGWAIVENQTDTDWNNISLSLVSGRPLSFEMDLYNPLYLARPMAKLELFEGLTPQTYAEAREEVEMAKPAAPMAAGRTREVRGDRDAKLSFGASVNTGFFAGDADASAVVSQATAGKIGELFQYSLSGITLARQSSAMVPIVTDPIDVTPISIYNSAVLARHPLSGARIKNTTDKHLLQGPITVFQGGGYAGDAQVNNVGPGQERLISYGIDLQTLIDSDKLDNTSEIMSVKIVKGSLTITNKSVSTRHYKMQNKSDKAKSIIIENPKTQGWDLVDSDKPVETTDTLYRFEKKLDAGKSGELLVKQQNVNYSAIGILNTDLNTLRWYTTNAKTPANVRDAIVKAMDLRQQQVELERQINEQNEQLNKISTEQNRIRENMKTIDKASDYYGRLMKKLNDQESQIEGLQTKVSELTESRDTKRTELETYLNDLNVE
jgi:hypothetical protein